MTSFKIIPPIIAHRGASAYAPENTLISFIKAMQMGVKWIEFDLMQAACGTPIIFHDDELDRITDGKGRVIDYDYAYLQTLDVGKWFDPRYSGERILTLMQLLDFLRGSNMYANLEIKALPGTEVTLIQSALPLLKEYLGEDYTKILFSSFSVNALKIVNQYLPKAQKGLLLHKWEQDWQKTALNLNCVSVHVFEEILMPEYVNTIKEMNMAVLSYTVNEQHRAQELFSMGVDAIFTDFPDKALSWWTSLHNPMLK